MLGSKFYSKFSVKFVFYQKRDVEKMKIMIIQISCLKNSGSLHWVQAYFVHWRLIQVINYDTKLVGKLLKNLGFMESVFVPFIIKSGKYCPKMQANLETYWRLQERKEYFFFLFVIMMPILIIWYSCNEYWL